MLLDNHIEEGFPGRVYDQKISILDLPNHYGHIQMFCFECSHVLKLPRRRLSQYFHQSSATLSRGICLSPSVVIFHLQLNTYFVCHSLYVTLFLTTVLCYLAIRMDGWMDMLILF